MCVQHIIFKQKNARLRRIYKIQKTYRYNFKDIYLYTQIQKTLKYNWRLIETHRYP
jgi:hypothetical protein